MRDNSASHILASVLDLFASLTELPIGWYEFPEGKESTHPPDMSRAHTGPYCECLHGLPHGLELCMRDEQARAKKALESGAPELTVCHAGLFNYSVPVRLHGRTQGVLLFGEMKFDSDEHAATCERNRRAVLGALGADPVTQNHLSQLYDRLTSRSSEEIERFRSIAESFERLFNGIAAESESATINRDRVTHEIQIRLQALMARAENLSRFAEVLSPTEVAVEARRVLAAVQAADTVINTIGNYLQAYRFEPAPVGPMIQQARRIYEPEGQKRDIELRIDLAGAQASAMVSPVHLQVALSNLIHNAIKYSFSGGPDRRRFVSVSGHVTGNEYVVTISNYGVGILPHEIASELIFKDGYQGELTDGEFRTGAGKGLPFVKQVIERHGGRLKVASDPAGDPEAGGLLPFRTTFRVFLPLARSSGR